MLPFRILSEGRHEFDYQMCEPFFEEYEALAEYSGEVSAKVFLLKKDSKQQLEISLKGMLSTFCDRCLEPMELPFETDGFYYIREAEEGEEEKEDVVFVQEDSMELDLSQLFYEMLMIGTPQRKMHKEEQCNVEMLEKMEALQAKQDKVDPRWAALEKLIKKEK